MNVIKAFKNRPKTGYLVNEYGERIGTYRRIESRNNVYHVYLYNMDKGCMTYKRFFEYCEELGLHTEEFEKTGWQIEKNMIRCI